MNKSQLQNIFQQTGTTVINHFATTTETQVDWAEGSQNQNEEVISATTTTATSSVNEVGGGEAGNQTETTQQQTNQDTTLQTNNTQDAPAVEEVQNTVSETGGAVEQQTVPETTGSTTPVPETIPVAE